MCRQLGFPYTDASIGSEFGPGVGNIWIVTVGCNGNENQLSECAHQWGSHDCGHDKDAGVICEGGTAFFRLIC